MPKEVRKMPYRSMDFSATVFPLVPVSDNVVDIVRDAVKRAVPFLENLTGLRYYPVPTWIVDEAVPAVEREDNMQSTTELMSIDLYGRYYHRNCDRISDLSRWLDRARFPIFFRPSKLGVVVIFVNRIRDRVDSTHSLEDCILATVLHEHAHAVTFEGINASNGCSGVQYRPPPDFTRNPRQLRTTGEEYQNGCKKPPCCPLWASMKEGLAEAAELIFFGNDVNMFQLIRSHADSGKMPDWPYAGGAVIDQKSRVSGDGTYALLLTYFREKDKQACETFVGRMSLAYALRTQKPVWEGSKYRDAVKAIASGCSVDSTTVADGCTRRLGLATKEFIDHVQRGPFDIRGVLLNRFPKHKEVIERWI